MKPTTEMKDGMLCLVGVDELSGARVFIQIPDGLAPAADIPADWVERLVENCEADTSGTVIQALVELGVLARVPQ